MNLTFIISCEFYATVILKLKDSKQHQLCIKFKDSKQHQLCITTFHKPYIPWQRKARHRAEITARIVADGVLKISSSK